MSGPTASRNPLTELIDRPTTERLDVNADSIGATRAFNVSVLISGVRCTLAYVVLPFLLPVLGLAPGVGPILGVPIGVIAIAANAVSIRRFWRVRHPWRRPVTAVHIAVIALLVVMLVIDVSALV